MNKEIKVSASVLCADFKKLGDEIRKCEDAGVDMIHVDIMDGHFVPVISIGPIIIDAIRPITKLPIDAHLMVQNPWTHFDQCIDSGADIISIHAECYGNLKDNCKKEGQFPKEIDELFADQAIRDIQYIKNKNKKAFMVINPGTRMCLKPVLNEIDGVLVMSVNPGFAKQKFMPEVLPKLAELKKFFKGDIAIDGGLNSETSPLAVKSGANIIATASYFFGSKDPKKVVQYLKSLT